MDIVKAGYRTIGQWPISFTAAMSGCTYRLSAGESDIMKEKQGDLVTIFRTNGILTEADMDAAGIASVNNTTSTPKDERALHKQRAVIMNSAECVRCYKDYKSKKVEAFVASVKKKEDVRLYKAWYNSLTAEAQKDERKMQRLSQGLVNRRGSLHHPCM